MGDKELKEMDALQLQRQYGAFKHSEGNFRCRKCLIVDGYTQEEKKCRHCGATLFEMDKL